MTWVLGGRRASTLLAGRAIDAYVKPMLSAAGVLLTQYKIPPPSSIPDIGNSVAVDQSAELKMRSQGIKTVMFLCSGCLPLFAQSAKSQHYYPRYIFSSMDSPGTTNDKETFGTSIGIGWEPVSADQDTYKHPKAFTDNPTFNLCRKIEKANISGTGSVIASMDLCEDVMDIYVAARANPTPDHHAGAAKYRVMQWSDKCTCLAYTGPTLAF